MQPGKVVAGDASTRVSSYRMMVEKVEAAVALEAQSNLSGEWCTMREGHLFHIPTLLET